VSRPVIFTPNDGKALTLDELSEFVAEAYAKGVPGTATPRAAGSMIGFDLAHGPRIARLTVDPAEGQS
jgi:hypothetical protein